MSRQLSAYDTRASRRDVPLARQLRVGIDADDQPPTPDAAPVAVPPAAPMVHDPEMGDSDWEEELSDDDRDHDYLQPEVESEDESEEDSDGDDEGLEIVSHHDTSNDSDEPLSQVFQSALQRRVARNAPGTTAFQWKDEENVPRIYGFHGSPGVQLPHLNGNSTPRDLFNAFFPDDLWKKMKEETNRYHDQKSPNTSSHMKRWEDVDELELQRYLGIRLLMGVNILPSYRDYWSRARFFGVQDLWPQMTRDRFDGITGHLHFSNNEDPLGVDDRLWKIRPVVQHLTECCKTVYVPEKEVTVDESLFKYHGRHHAIQYNPRKRARFGLKVYKLCSSTGPAPGYTSAMQVYMGKDRSEVPASQRAVVNLMDEAGLFHKGYDLYTDNWYTSPTLFHHLKARKTNAVGTVRPNRKWMPTDLKVTRERGNTCIRSTPTGQLALAWMDKKQVTVLSTVHKGDEMDVLPPNRRGESVVKPRAIVDYNRGMKGVDLSDQLAHYYRTPRKARKWYHNLFFHLVDTAVVNAYLVHKVLTGGSLNHLKFRVALIDSLLPKDRPVPRPVRRPVVRVIPRLQDVDDPQAGPSHQPRPVPEGHLLQRQVKYRRCAYCKAKRQKRKETRFHCSVCNVGLCPGECFNVYNHQRAH